MRYNYNYYYYYYYYFYYYFYYYYYSLLTKGRSSGRSLSPSITNNIGLTVLECRLSG